MESQKLKKKKNTKSNPMHFKKCKYEIIANDISL